MTAKTHWRTQLKIKKMLAIGLPQRTIAKALDCYPATIKKFSQEMPKENPYVNLINYLNSIKVFE